MFPTSLSFPFPETSIATVWTALPFTPIILLLHVLLLLLVLLVVLQPETIPWKPQTPRPEPLHHCPPSYPVIGCLISFYKNRTRLLDWYTEMLANSTTGTITVQRFGARRTVITTNPNNVEYILKSNFKNYPKGKPFTDILGDFLGSGIFNVDGELWKKQRKLASHEFNTNSLKEYAMNALKKEIEGGLLPAMEAVAGDGYLVDLQDLLRRLGFSLICKVSLGIDIPCSLLDLSMPNYPLAKAFDVSSEICARRGAATLAFSWKIKRWLKVGSEWRLREAIKEIHENIGQAIREKIEKVNGVKKLNQSDLITRLIVAGYDEEMIRDMAISFIMAGRDTTSAVMTWLFWILSRHPNIEQELLKEIEEVIKGKELRYDSLSELKLLDACLYESMRLYPPVAWDSKHAIEDDVLPDGSFIKSGDRVTYFPYGMGRMEALWGKDRLEFKPSRWFSEPDLEIKKVSPFKFPVFQAGPRDCIGKQMAFIQMKYVVASILLRFCIKPVDGGHPIFVPLLTAHMAGGFRVFVCKRESS